MTHDFWRTLDELADDPSFRDRLYNEFPSQIETITDPVQRRTFLKLMGASLALAGVTACTRQPDETIVPYVRQPEEIVPGRPLFYATAMTLGGMATGVLVESHEGRPTKVEGNPDHPSSLGSADAYGQAAVLELYDPDRSRTLTNLGEIRPWSSFIGAIRAALNGQQAVRGAGVRILTESVSSPTLAAQIRDVLSRYPQGRWHQWDPVGRPNTHAGAKLAFGDYVETQYRLDAADVIVSLDANFLELGPGRLRYAREFVARRNPAEPQRMNRLYVVETMPTLTGAKSDHRRAARPSDVPDIATRLLAAVRGGAQETDRWISAAAKDLQAHRGSSLVLAGESQPPHVHAIAHALNDALGNAGKTVIYTDPVEAEPSDHVASLRELTTEMTGGKVDVLLILGSNPVYTAPADFGFAQAMEKVPLRIHLGLHTDETSALCHWHIPQAHFLEAWSDARAHDGTASIVQPLIAPLYGGKSAHEVLATMTDRPEQTGHDIVNAYWATRFGDSRPAAARTTPNPAFTAAWRRWLHDGVIPNTACAERRVSLRSDALASNTSSSPAGPTPDANQLQLAFRLDPAVLDGRFANNGWLQELPKPITRLTWDNAIIVSPGTADRLRAENRLSFQGGEHGQLISDVVELTSGGRSVRGAVFAVPGHADDAATVHLGYGRDRGGRIAAGAGFNAYALRTADAFWFAGNVAIAQTGGTASLACTQDHHLMDGRGMVRVAALGEFVRNPQSMHEVPAGEREPDENTNEHGVITLYPAYKYEGHKWGMAIDINACIGCNACVVACQAENNIPVIGKSEVLRGREMHWLRVDTYYRGPVERPETYFEPVPCQQCENAPCEVVCPVGATVHSHEGLNDMVYNRCVGTRYCSNNCPYKVRRFNFLLYQDWDTPSLKLGRNPDVTVRSRGVMEKCTYCVQRINAGKIAAEKEDRPVRDGEIRTACQQTCPADAIVFGDLNDQGSRVAKLQADVRNYSLLADLNTRPRTTYLGAIRNPNPELGD
jgi:molybdopterin-containing oxidoreductase family iron-sulfur binding subunit